MTDYFTIEELRALPDMNNATKFPTTRVEAAAAYIVGAIEREVGTSFIVRDVLDEQHDGSYPIILDDVYARTVLSATEDGDTVTDSLTIVGGVVRRYQGVTARPWAEGYGNVLISYTAGYSVSPPDDVKEMALKGTRAHLMATAANSSINDRQTSLTAGDSVIGFVVAGENRPTGYPEVDAMILGWKRKLNGPSVG